MGSVASWPMPGRVHRSPAPDRGWDSAVWEVSRRDSAVQPDAGRSAWVGDGRYRQPSVMLALWVWIASHAVRSLGSRSLASDAGEPRQHLEKPWNHPPGRRARTDHARHRLTSWRHLTTARTACGLSRMPQMGGRLRRGEAQLWVIVHGADPGLLKDSRRGGARPMLEQANAQTSSFERSTSSRGSCHDLPQLLRLGEIPESISVVACWPALGGRTR